MIAPDKRITQYNISDWEENSGESSVGEEDKGEQLINSDDYYQISSASFNNSSLNDEDFTKDEIKEYKSSLIHDEDSVRARLNKVVAKKGKLNVVMIAEKPNIAEIITQALSSGEYYRETWRGFKTYHFNKQKFKDFNANFTVCSVYGNMHEYDFDRNTNMMRKNPVNILVNYPF